MVWYLRERRCSFLVAPVPDARPSVSASAPSCPRPPLTPFILAVRAIANQRAPFVRIDGEVHYSSITAKEAKKYFDGASTALVRQRCSSRLTGCSY